MARKFAKVFEQVNGAEMASRVETFALDEAPGGRGFGIRVKGTNEGHGVRVLPAADIPPMDHENFALMLGRWMRERDRQVGALS